MILAKVISGGQAGAEQGGLRAAKARGVPTGARVPRGWKTEAASRTKRNVSVAHGVLWFGNPHSPGGRLTMWAAVKANVDTFVVLAQSTPQDVTDWIVGHLLPGNEEAGVVLMVASNRESCSPGIGATAERFVGEVLDLLAKEGQG